jgi:excisionase family DNA binding protein
MRPLTTRQAATRLGVSTAFVLGEIHDGRLPAIILARPGKARRVYRVTPAALETYRRRYCWSSTKWVDAPAVPRKNRR